MFFFFFSFFIFGYVPVRFFIVRFIFVFGECALIAAAATEVEEESWRPEVL